MPDDLLPALAPESPPDASEPPVGGPLVRAGEPTAVAVSVADAALEAAVEFAGQALAPATLRAYRAAWRHFCEWCDWAGRPALPASPEIVAAYLAALAPNCATSTLEQRLAAIGRAHNLAGETWQATHPAIRNTLRGIRRRHARPAKQAAALMTAEVTRLAAACDRGLAGLRDRALLLLGYAGALRRSELAAVAFEHLQFTAEGLRLMIPRAKGDQGGEGVSIGLPRGNSAETCPVRALETWMQASDCRYGPVFRSIDQRGVIGASALHPDAVRRILAARAAKAGLKPPVGERLSPHGLRAGFITQAYVNGARDEQIMDHTRQKDLRTMRGYVRRARLVGDSPAKLLGL